MITHIHPDNPVDRQNVKFLKIKMADGCHLEI